MRILLISVLFASSLLVGCRSSPTGPLQVPLSFQPTDEVTGAPGVRIQFGMMGSTASVNPQDGVPGTQAVLRGPLAVSLLDERSQKSAIGENREGSPPIRILSSDSPTQFVRTVLVQQLKEQGAQIVEEAAARALVVHLTKFWAEEVDTYNCRISARAEVLDDTGKARWEGIVNGTSKQFGRSLKVENYQECLSNATVRMVRALLADPGLVAAMK